MTAIKEFESFVLASNSPRRRELLGLGGVPFNVQPTEVDERVRDNETPEDYVLRLAAEKAKVAGAKFGPEALVLAADTTVVHEGRILGKPANANEARAMLKSLRGRSHLVFTGLALLINGRMVTDLAMTEVPMRAYSDAEIEAYIASRDPFDKAGGYAIQHAGFHPVDVLAGCYANVVGLPLCHLLRNLAKWGLSVETDLPTACQAHLGYDCPVYETILKWEQ